MGTMESGKILAARIAGGKATCPTCKGPLVGNVAGIPHRVPKGGPPRGLNKSVVGVLLCQRDRQLVALPEAAYLVGEIFHLEDDEDGLHWAWHRGGTCPWGRCAPGS